MMSLPVSLQALSLAKFCILIFYLFMETFVFLAVFVIAGYIAVSTFDITEALPILPSEMVRRLFLIHAPKPWLLCGC